MQVLHDRLQLHRWGKRHSFQIRCLPFPVTPLAQHQKISSGRSMVDLLDWLESLPTVCGYLACCWLEVWRLRPCLNVGPCGKLERGGGGGGGGEGGGEGLVKALRHAVSGGRGLSRFNGFFSLQLRANQSWQPSWVNSGQWGTSCGCQGKSRVCWHTTKTWGRGKENVSGCCFKTSSNFNHWGEKVNNTQDSLISMWYFMKFNSAGIEFKTIVQHGRDYSHKQSRQP